MCFSLFLDCALPCPAGRFFFYDGLRRVDHVGQRVNRPLLGPPCLLKAGDLRLVALRLEQLLARSSDVVRSKFSPASATVARGSCSAGSCMRNLAGSGSFYCRRAQERKRCGVFPTREKCVILLVRAKICRNSGAGAPPGSPEQILRMVPPGPRFYVRTAEGVHVMSRGGPLVLLVCRSRNSAGCRVGGARRRPRMRPTRAAAKGW